MISFLSGHMGMSVGVLRGVRQDSEEDLKDCDEERPEIEE
jgi:hypothetical protein